MKLERKKNAVRNIKFGLLNKLITIICPFILRTVLIYTLGSEYLGLSSLFTSVLQVLSLSELGIGSAMVFSLYQPIAKGDIYKIRELASLYKFIYRIIGFVILAGGCIVLPFLPHFIHGGYPDDINIYVLYIVYLLNSSESYFIAAYKSTILSACQRRDIISNIGLIVHLFLYLLQVICLLCFRNYYVYVIWIPVFTVIENIVTAIYVNKKYPDYVIEVNYSINSLKEIIGKVKDLFGHKLSQVVTNSADTIVISSFLGLHMVTVYNNYYYLMSAVSGVLDIVYQAILAGIGNSLFSENLEKNISDFKKFAVLNSWLAGWCSICFLCLYQPMMRIWMGEKLMLSFDTVILLSIYFYVWKIRQTILTYKDAAGIWDIDRWKPYIEIMVNIILNIILVQVIGINGVVISTILSMVIVSIPWETKVFLRKLFNQRPDKYYRLCMFYTAISISAACITWMVCCLLEDSGMISFMLKIIICIMLPNIIILVLGWRKDGHAETVKFIVSLTPLKRILK